MPAAVAPAAPRPRNIFSCLHDIARFARRAALAIGLAAAAALPALAETPAAPLPALTGRVVDEAALLTPVQKQELTQKLAEIETETGSQLVVVTLKSLRGRSIEEIGVALGRGWGIGRKGVDDGVLLIVAPAERKVRIEVGYGLEGALTDALSALIIHNAILPEFRSGDFPAGIRAGVRDIRTIITGNAADISARYKPASERSFSELEWFEQLIILIALAMFLVVLWQAIRNGNVTSGSRDDNDWSSGSSYSSGSSGGFSGGGGSFGGGGSSGSW